MAILRIQAVLGRWTNLALDTINNTWHFTVPDLVPESYAGDCFDLIEEFYTTDSNGSLSVFDWYPGGTFSNITGNVRLDAYNLADPEPRVPIDTRNITPPLNTTDSLPGEVALCLSFKNTHISGVPVGRRRGRIFLGPFNTGALATTGGEQDMEGRPATSMVTTILNAGTRLRDAALTGDVAWSIYSRTDDEAYVVSQVSIDNAFDTVRSRGVKPSVRVVDSA